MADEVRLWRIEKGDGLREMAQSHLDLEVRIEQWLRNDISILSPDLLVIGQQVQTASGGLIDLLCINQAGDLIVVELKRDKTPREVTAQVLDYGSWVVDLSHERVMAIAEDYLHGRFEEAFKTRFSNSDLPETLNDNHALMVVASQIDPSSERIIKYLSRVYGVNINAATFQYFRDADGSELLARVFLIEPAEVDTNVQKGGSLSRRPNLTYEQLEDVAEANGVGDLYRYVVAALERHLQKRTTRSSIGFGGLFPDGSRKVVVSLIPQESNADDGLRFQIYLQRFQTLLCLSESEALGLLPANRVPWAFSGSTDPDWGGFQGFIKSNDEIDRLGQSVLTRPVVDGSPLNESSQEVRCEPGW